MLTQANEISSGRLFKLYRKAGFLKPGLTFLTSDSDNNVGAYALRQGIKVRTERLYSMDLATESVVKFVRVTVLEVHPLPTTNNQQPTANNQ